MIHLDLPKTEDVTLLMSTHKAFSLPDLAVHEGISVDSITSMTQPLKELNNATGCFGRYPILLQYFPTAA